MPELRVDGGPDSRSRVVRDRWDKDVGEKSALDPTAVPIAIEATAAGDKQRPASLEPLSCEPLEAVEDGVAIDPGEIAECGILEANVTMGGFPEVFILRKFAIRSVGAVSLMRTGLHRMYYAL